MSDIFREVDEEVRREKAAQFWNKHQNLIIGLAVLIVVAAGSWRYWQYSTRTAAEKAGLEFQDAIQLSLGDNEKKKEAAAAFERIAKQGPSGYAVLAKFRAANLLEASDKADAMRAYDAIAADATTPATLQDAARLRAAYIAIDTATLDDMKKRLEPMIARGRAFRISALELLALAAIKAQQYDAATTWLDLLIASPEAPESARGRANALQGLVAGAREFKKG